MTRALPPVDACETHLSEVFLGTDRVYKRLKAVDLPFLNLRDTSERCAAATKEFHRNHAISPNVYLGTADVIEDGELADRLIVMRRLADQDQLQHLLGEPCAKDTLVAVARRIANVHVSARVLAGECAVPASTEAIRKNWTDNFDALRPVVGTIIDPEEFEAVRSAATTWIDGRNALFGERITSGWVRDGHGDLRAEHVYCTTQGVELIDCLAFNDDLKFADVLADVAFLAMDVERIAGPQAAEDLMRAWGVFTGERHPSSLAHFYVAYRAHVRCKIAAIKYQEHPSPQRAHEVRTYHHLAHRHLDLARVRMVIIGGGPGTGKSTISERVAASIGAAWIRTDEVRKDVAGIAHTDHAFAGPDEGIYTPEMTKATIAEVMRRADLLLSRGISVVLDATWRKEHHRDQARALAEETHSTVTEVQCVLEPAIAKERIARRMASMFDPSDATPDLVDFMADRFDVWPQAAKINTGAPVDRSVAAALKAITGEGQRVVVVAQRFPDQLHRLSEIILLTGGLPAAPTMSRRRPDEPRSWGEWRLRHAPSGPSHAPIGSH